MKRASFISAAITVLFLGHDGVAQNLTDEEMLKRFNSQREAFSAAKSGDLGATRGIATRGLTLVTVGDEEAGDSVSGSVTVEGSVQPASESIANVAIDPENAAIEPKNVAADPDKDLVFGVLALELQVNLQVGFGFDSATIAESEKPKLAQICSVMKASDIKQFRIIGHTDSVGSDEYNRRLSVLRAEEVTRYLIADCGINPARLEAIGLGERFLFDRNDPAADVNRRVEFQAIS